MRRSKADFSYHAALRGKPNSVRGRVRCAVRISTAFQNIIATVRNIDKLMTFARAYNSLEAKAQSHKLAQPFGSCCHNFFLNLGNKRK